MPTSVTDKTDRRGFCQFCQFLREARFPRARCLTRSDSCSSERPRIDRVQGVDRLRRDPIKVGERFAPGLDLLVCQSGPTNLCGVCLSPRAVRQVAVAERNACQLWRTTALVKGFGRRPLRQLGVRRGQRPKASQGGNRGEVGGPFVGRAYGDLRIADGFRARRRGLAALGVFSGSGEGGRFR
jgi:hypothetical protein